MKSRLFEKYKEKVTPALREEFDYKNMMRVPRLEKVVVNVGYGRHAKDKAYIENVEKTLELITGQRPIRKKAKKSISNFKIRQGDEVGSSVTLRGKKMYDFLDKLISVTLPRVRDFRGINPNSFDKQGNYTIGFKENLAFPEINVDAVENVHGLEVVICTTAQSKEEAMPLLEKLGFPFRKK